MAEVFDPDAFLAGEAGEAFDPDAFLAEGTTAAPPAPIPGLAEAPSATWADAGPSPAVPAGFNEAVSADVERAARHERLRIAFQLAAGGTDETQVLKVARQLGVPTSNVRDNLQAFQQTAEAAQLDPARWEADNPELARLVTQHPDMGPLVVREKTLGPITRALYAATDLVKDALGVMSEADIAAEEAWAKQLPDNPDVALRVDTAAEAEARKQAERAQRDAPRQVLEREDAKARVLREDTSLGARAVRLYARAQETQQRLDISRLKFQLMLAENGLSSVGTPEELRSRLYDAELKATPRAYGDDAGLARDLSTAVEGAVSTVDVLGGALEGAGLAGGVGAVVGGALGAAATKTPAGAMAGAREGLKLAAGPGARAGAGWATFQLEAGDSYGELSTLRTDKGQALTPAEAMGGAVLAGVIKSGLEVVSLGQQTKVVTAPLAGQVAARLAADAGFRRVAAKLGAEWVKSMAAEGLTEGAQDAVDQASRYLAASLKDEALQAGPVVDVAQTVQAVEAGVLGAALLGAGTTAVGAGMERLQASRAALAAKQVQPVLELAQQPAVQAAPEVFADMVAKAGEAAGAPVQALHVDGAAVLRYFQEQGVAGPAALDVVEQLVGPGAKERLLEAAATGGKLEVPLEAALSTWGRSEVGRALVEDTTTDATALTPRQAREQAATIEAEAQAIAAAETARTAEAEALTTQLRAFEDQVVAAGRPRAEARAASAVVRAFMETQAADFATAATALFPEVPVAFAPAPAAAAAGPAQTLAQAEAPAPAVAAGQQAVVLEAGVEAVQAYAQSEGVALQVAAGDALRVESLALPEGAEGTAAAARVVQRLAAYADAAGQPLVVAPAAVEAVPADAEAWRAAGFQPGPAGEAAGGVLYRPPQPAAPTLAQDGGESPTPKGYVELPVGRPLQAAVRAFLSPTADASTVIHESAHAFLEHLGDLASRPDAPQRTKDTYAQALAALGVQARQDVGRAQHERFARSFEAYLLEGKAPKAGLRRAFARFASWLTRLYRVVSNIPEANLTPELRAVFDAMLATEGQLKAMRKAEGPTAPATTPQQQDALAAEEEEYAEGSRDAQLAAVKDALRAREKWWKQGLQQLEAQFAEEYEALPGRRAQRFVQASGTGLDRAAVRELSGALRLPGVTLVEGGLRPSQVAEAAGFPSADVMLAALAGLRPKEAWVRQQAEAEMQRFHPGILDDTKRFRALLADGLHQATEARLLREWRGLPKEALRRAAAVLAEKREAGQLRPGRALAQQRQAAQRKARAAAAGNVAAAAEAAREELLSHYLYRELLAAEKEVGQLEAAATRLTKKAAQERLGKAAPAYRDGMAFLLGAVGLGSDSGLTVDALETAVGQLEGDAVVVGDPEWLAPVRAALAKQVPYARLSMADVRALYAAVKQLEAGARNRSTVLLEGQRVDFEQVKSDVLAEIASTLPEAPPVVAKHARTVGEKLRAGVNAFDGMLVTPVEMVRDLTGDNMRSTLHRAVVLPMRRAMAQEADLLAERVQPILAAFESMPDSVRDGLNDVVDGKRLFPTHDPRLAPPRRRYELLMLALNSGSESSLQVLTEGRSISEAQVRNALNLLTPAEVEWVNTVWRSLEALREPAFALEERETGLRPRAVEARPMTVKGGVLQGGYFPLKAEPEASTVGARQVGEEELAALLDPTFTRPGTAHGHLKSRTGAAYPVTLDPNVIRRHLLQVAHDIAFREPVKSVGRLVMDPEVQAALTERLGPERTKEWLLWLKDIGGANGLQTNVMESLLRGLKRNVASAVLSGLSTAAGNFANLPAAVTSTALKSKHLAAALASFSAAPRETRRQALELSGVLRSQSNKLVEELQREVDSAMSSKASRGLEWLKEASFAAMRGVDVIVGTSVWQGAYRQALAMGLEGGKDGPAVRWADDIYLRVQPSISNVERARILRDKGWVGSLAQFYTYLNTVYRANRRIAAPLATQEFQEASLLDKGKVAGKVAGQLVAFAISWQVLGELVMGRGPEDGDRDEEDPENKALQWRNWFLRKVLISPLATIPIVPLASVVEGLVLDKKTNPRTDPAAAALIQLGRAASVLRKAMEGEGDGAKATVESLRVIGLATGAPTRLLETTGRYLWEVTAGDREVDGVADFFSGVLYGPPRAKQPDNLFTALGE